MLRASLGMLLYIIATASTGAAFVGVILAISSSIETGFPYMVGGWLGLTISGLCIWKLMPKQEGGALSC